MTSASIVAIASPDPIVIVPVLASLRTDYRNAV
jgi:hypothetical protein